VISAIPAGARAASGCRFAKECRAACCCANFAFPPGGAEHAARFRQQFLEDPGIRIPGGDLGKLEQPPGALSGLIYPYQDHRSTRPGGGAASIRRRLAEKGGGQLPAATACASAIFSRRSPIPATWRWPARWRPDLLRLGMMGQIFPTAAQRMGAWCGGRRPPMPPALRGGTAGGRVDRRGSICRAAVRPVWLRVMLKTTPLNPLPSPPCCFREALRAFYEPGVRPALRLPSET